MKKVQCKKCGREFKQDGLDVHMSKVHGRESEEPWKNPKWLKKEIFYKQRPAKEVAEELDLTQPNISYWCNQYDIDYIGGNNRGPYNIPQWLEHHIVIHSRTVKEVAKKSDTKQSIIKSRLDRFNIERPKPKHRQKEVLQSFVNQNMNPKEIANELDKSVSTIRKWLNIHNINGWRRSIGRDRVFSRTKYVIYTDNETNKTVSEHQLLAIAEGVDPHKVFSEDYPIHHIIPYRFLNIPQNLECMERSEHINLHNGKTIPYKIPDIEEIMEDRDSVSDDYEYKTLYTYDY